MKDALPFSTSLSPQDVQLIAFAIVILGRGKDYPDISVFVPEATAPSECGGNTIIYGIGDFDGR